MGINTKQTMSDDCLIGELERVIEKEKQKEEIFPDENIIFTLPKAPIILDDEDFQIKQEIKKQKDDKINEEIDLTRLKDEIDAEISLGKLNFTLEGKITTFF